VADKAMVVAFWLGSSSGLVRFLCSYLCITGIDYYTRREVFRSLKDYFIHSIMEYHTGSVFSATGE
jgi:hypothetical protein